MTLFMIQLTGTYQPLDRRIFGIVKKQLQAQSFDENENDKKRADFFRIFHRNDKNIWNGI